MKPSALRIPLLALLVLLPTASRLAASGDPPATRKKTVDKNVVIDKDRVMVWNDDDDPEIVADLPDFDDSDFPTVHFLGHAGGGYLGVSSVGMTPELRRHFGAPEHAGVFVGTVESDSPAAKAGLQVGDIITAVDGDQIASSRELSRSVRRHKDGDKVKVDVLRERSAKSLSVTLVARKDREIRIGDFGHGPRGFRWRDWADDGPAVAPLPPVPPVAPVPPVPPDASRGSGLRERLDSLERRLREIE
ncbi:MAG: PDZ domain-containing protein, partial [Acidobacteriota bacterium]